MTLIRIAVAACAVAAMLALPSSGGEVTWDGSCTDNNWHTCCDLGGGVFENNWDFGPGPQCPLPLPGPEDDVDAGQEPVLLNQSPEEIKSLISGGEFSIGGVDLTVTQGAFLSAFNLGGGGLHTGGAVVAAGPFAWTGGQLAHLGGPPVYTEIRGPLTLSGGGHVLRGRQVVCTGGVTWIGGALTLAEGTTFDNQSTFTVRCDQTVDGSDGAVFLNSRTFTKQETTGETRFLGGAAFHNGPTANVTVQTGTLRFEGGGRNEGGLSVFDDAVLRFKSGSFGFLTDTSVQGPGLFWVDGAVVELLDETRLSMEKLRVTGGQLLGPGTIAAADMDWVSGTVGGGGQTFADRLTMSGAVTRVLSDHELVSNGNATWTGTAPLVMLTGSAFSNNGRMTLSAGLKRVTMSDGAEWINERGSTLDILANVDFGFGGAGGKVTNSEATMNVGPGSTLCEFQSNVPFEQFGTLNLRSGTMLVRGGESLSGLFDLSAGTVFQLQSKPFAVEGATFQGEGLLRVGLGGTLEARGGTTTAPKVELAAGSAGVSGDGDLEVTGVLDWLQGSMTGTGKTISKTTLNIDGLANLTINQRTLRNEGDVVWSSGNLVLDAGARFENAPGGVVDMDAPHDFLHNTGNEGVVHNEGILRKLIDPTLLVFPSGVRLVNRDVVSLGKGDIRIAGPSTSSGLYAIAPGSTVEFSGFANTLEAGTRFQGIGRALVGGSIQVTGADVRAQTLELAGDVEGLGTITVSDSLRWTRGTMRHAGTTRNDGSMTIDNANDVVIDTRTLLNTGTATFVGSRDISLRNGGTVNNQGTFDLRNDRTISSSGGGQIINSGTLRKSVGDGDVMQRITASLLNSGRVEVVEGNLALSTGSSTGDFEIADRYDVRFIGSSYTLKAGTDIRGEGEAAVYGGEVVIEDQVIAENFAISFGTLTGPGDLIVEVLVWVNGDQTGSGSTIADALILTANSETRVLERRRVEMLGFSTWFSGSIEGRDGGVLRNRGTFRTSHPFEPGGFVGGNAALFDNLGAFTHAVAGTLTIGVTFNNSGVVQVDDPAVLRVTGDYVQNGGALLVGTGRVEFTRPADLRGGRLGGEGTVNGDTRNSGGTLGPGRSAGTLTLEGDYVQEAGGTFEVELGGTNQGAEYDHVIVTGAATLDGTLDILIIDDFAPQVGDTFQVMTYSARSGAFAETGAPCGYEFAVQYNATDVTLEVTDANVFPPGDIDGDCDVDLADHELFYGCMGGPGVTDPPQGCDPIHFSRADFEIDDDVDLGDFTRLQPRIGG